MSEEIRIKLSDEQIRSIRQSFKFSSTSEELITKVFLRVAEELNEQVEDTWDQIFKLAEGITRYTHGCTVDYVTQSLIFKPLDDKFDDE